MTDCRVWTVPAEDRTFVVPTEGDNTVTIGPTITVTTPELRTWTVPAEDRVWKVLCD
jgi:hypothetical protein